MRGLRERGFTLLEVLMAVALGAGVLVAVNFFLLSMGELWGRGSDERLFDQHVRGVARFLDQLTRQAVTTTADTAAGGSGTPAGPFTLERPKGQESLAEPLLSFEVDESPGVCVWAGPPLPRVVLWLLVDPAQGLVLLWQSRLEEDFGEQPPRATLLSPFAREISYEYWDESGLAWQRETRLRSAGGGNPELPGRLRLVFRRGELSREVVLPLPTTGARVPLW